MAASSTSTRQSAFIISIVLLFFFFLLLLFFFFVVGTAPKNGVGDKDYQSRIDVFPSPIVDLSFVG